MKAIALDLDGTLVNNNKVVSKENIEILRKLHNNGVEILIAKLIKIQINEFEFILLKKVAMVKTR